MKPKRQFPGCLYRRNRRWWWKVKFPGDTKPRAIPMRLSGQPKATVDKAAAEIMARRLWERAASLGVAPPGVSELIDKYTVELARTVKPGEVHASSGRIRRFVEAQSIRNPDDITAESVMAYLGKLQKAGRSPWTINHYRNSISSFCEFLITCGDLVTNPVRRVKSSRTPKAHDRFMTPADIEELLRRAKAAGMYTEIMIGLHTGMRLGQILALRWVQIRKADDGLYIDTTSDKRNSPWDYSIPVSPTLEAVLNALPRCKPDDHLFKQVLPRQWSKKMEKLVKGMPFFDNHPAKSASKWHLLRHTFASRIISEGKAQLVQAKDMLGHSDIRSTLRYAHLLKDHGRAVVERL